MPDLPPHDADAENAIAACLLVGSLDALTLSDWVAPEQFYGLAPRRIFEAALAIERSGRRVDVTELTTALRSSGRLQEIGGTTELARLADETPAIGNPRQYAETVRRYSQRRRIADLAKVLVAESRGDVAETDTWIQSVESRVFALSHEAQKREELEHVAQALVNFTAHLQARNETNACPATARSGLVDLDRKLRGGLQPGSLCVVAGRPGMGKSSFALQFATATALKNRVAIVLSLEMPVPEIVGRMVSQLACVPHADIDKERPNSETFRSIVRAQNLIAGSPLYLESCSQLTPTGLRSRIRRALLRSARDGHEPGVVVVDYLQLMGSEAEKGASRERQVSSNSAALKQIAQEFKVPIVLLSQLNRDLEKRDDKRPKLSDLRESGAIEQDADVVLFVHRPDYFDRNSSGARQDDEALLESEIIVAKHRNGSTGVVHVMWRPSRMEFVGAMSPTERAATAANDDFYDSLDGFA